MLKNTIAPSTRDNAISIRRILCDVRMARVALYSKNFFGPVTKSYYAFTKSLPKEAPRFLYRDNDRRVFDSPQKAPEISRPYRNSVGAAAAQRKKIPRLFKQPPN